MKPHSLTLALLLISMLGLSGCQQMEEKPAAQSQIPPASNAQELADQRVGMEAFVATAQQTEVALGRARSLGVAPADTFQQLEKAANAAQNGDYTAAIRTLEALRIEAEEAYRLARKTNQ